MPNVVSKLDVRVLPPREKHPAIFRLIDELKAGEALQITNDHDPMPLFYQIQAERPGQFQWVKGEAGPEVWTVDIVKN